MNNLRLAPLLFFISLFFISCDDILFVQPQPSWSTKKEAAFPEKLRGMYINQRDDSIMIGSKSITPVHPKKEDIIYTLSDSLVLRMDNNTYYLNIKVNQYWDVMLGKLKGDSLITFTLDGKDENIRKAIAAITPFIGLKDDSTKYVINPSAVEFRKILDKQIFKRGDVYVRMHK